MSGSREEFSRPALSRAQAEAARLGRLFVDLAVLAAPQQARLHFSDGAREFRGAKVSGDVSGNLAFTASVADLHSQLPSAVRALFSDGCDRTVARKDVNSVALERPRPFSIVGSMPGPSDYIHWSPIPKFDCKTTIGFRCAPSFGVVPRCMQSPCKLEG
jgi:hypothetical protein